MTADTVSLSVHRRACEALDAELTANAELRRQLDVAKATIMELRAEIDGSMPGAGW